MATNLGNLAKENWPFCFLKDLDALAASAIELPNRKT